MERARAEREEAGGRRKTRRLGRPVTVPCALRAPRLPSARLAATSGNIDFPRCQCGSSLPLPRCLGLPVTECWSLHPSQQPRTANAIRLPPYQLRSQQACAPHPRLPVPAGWRAGSKPTRPDDLPLQPASSAGCFPESAGSARCWFSASVWMVGGGLCHDAPRQTISGWAKSLYSIG